jgi:hypothetical protein
MDTQWDHRQARGKCYLGITKTEGGCKADHETRCNEEGGESVLRQHEGLGLVVVDTSWL